jgi:hypothetical protein
MQLSTVSISVTMEKQNPSSFAFHECHDLLVQF